VTEQSASEEQRLSRKQLQRKVEERFGLSESNAYST